jgi:hypothetical protein
MKKPLVVKKTLQASKQVEKKVKVFPVVVMEHLTADHFSLHHRMNVGVVVMFVGIFVAKFGHFIHPSTIILFIADGIGYMLHGAGCIPFVEHFTKLGLKLAAAKDEKKEAEQTKVVETKPVEKKLPIVQEVTEDV